MLRFCRLFLPCILHVWESEDEIPITGLCIEPTRYETEPMYLSSNKGRRIQDRNEQVRATACQCCYKGHPAGAVIVMEALDDTCAVYTFKLVYRKPAGD